MKSLLYYDITKNNLNYFTLKNYKKSLGVLKIFRIIVFLFITGSINSSKVMVKKLLYAALIVPFILLSQQAHAQDPHFSQYYANPVYLNQ